MAFCVGMGAGINERGTVFIVLPHECGFEPLHYAVSPRTRCGMDVIARKR